ncbi:MAG: hypothetical protein GF317_07020, partial [Candidatus Lokiarchaeota archaeon]|nr:hypothetical protein [Candidatus Lokiarchaeota archaeon]
MSSSLDLQFKKEKINYLILKLIYVLRPKYIHNANVAITILTNPIARGRLRIESSAPQTT